MLPMRYGDTNIVLKKPYVCRVRSNYHEKKEIIVFFAKIITALVILFTVLLLIFFAGRYGWRLRGFDACESAGIEHVSVTDGQVEIIGFEPSGFPSGFLGYYAEEKDGRLDVGFKFSSVFGFFETGDFQIQIPTQGKITEVYIKTGQNEYLIWSAENE